jgi:hypothetical protein
MNIEIRSWGDDFEEDCPEKMDLIIVVVHLKRIGILIAHS